MIEILNKTPSLFIKDFGEWKGKGVELQIASDIHTKYQTSSPIIKHFEIWGRGEGMSCSLWKEERWNAT